MITTDGSVVVGEFVDKRPREKDDYQRAKDGK